MSPVIAFDIAVVAQKVLVQYWGPVWSEKSGAGGSVIGRDGYNEELLAEVTKMIQRF